MNTPRVGPTADASAAVDTSIANHHASYCPTFHGRWPRPQFIDSITDPVALAAGTVNARKLTSQFTPHGSGVVEGDSAGSLKRYSFADTGLDEDELRERAREYQEYFDIESEQLS